MPGQVVDLGDHAPAQEIIRGSGPEQLFVKGDLLFVSQLHSDKVEVFRINQSPADPSQILTQIGLEFTGGITPQGLAVSPDGSDASTWRIMQTEDVSFLGVESHRRLTRRQGYVAVGVTDKTPDPTDGGNGDHLFATHEEIGLRWLFTQSYSDDGQKSCGHCHWQSRHDGGQWNVGGNAIGGPRSRPQNKDISDNWPEWFEGLSSDMNSLRLLLQRRAGRGRESDRALPAGATRGPAAGARRVRPAQDRGELPRDRPAGVERQGLQIGLLRHGLRPDPLDPERDAPACPIR